MTKDQLKKEILTKKSLLKKGAIWLAEKYSISENSVREVLKGLKDEAREYRGVISAPTKKNKLEDCIRGQIESLEKFGQVRIKSEKISEKSNYNEGMHLVLSCVHVPFENKKFVESIIQFIGDYKDSITGFHLIGDVVDMKSLAFQEKGNVPIPGLTLGYEYKKTNDLLDRFDIVLNKNVQKSYIWGNHEDRHTRLKNTNDASQYMDALPSPTQALKLKERGYNVKENWKEDYIQLGKIQLIHGIFCSTTPAKKHLNVIKHSVMFGHTHRIDTYYESDNGSFNIGCLADIDSDGFRYLSRVERMNWKNGFGLIHLDKDGNFQADVIHALNGSFFYGGKKY